MSNCNNSNQNCTGNNIYVSGAETRSIIEVTNNKSRYYAELAETYKNKAKEYCDTARYYAEQNSDVSMNYVNTLEATLLNLIDAKQDSGDYALNSAIPTNNNQLTNGAGYITGVTSSDITTALTYTPADIDLSNLSTTGQAVISGKMNVDCSNASSSLINFDGQWVYSYSLLASSVTYPTSADLEYSIASILPQDNYQYEVLVGLKVTTTSTSGKSVWGRLYTDIFNSGNQVCYARTRTSSTMDAAGSIILPVGTGRKVIVQKDPDANGTFNLYFTGYRRIGTNQ